VAGAWSTHTARNSSSRSKPGNTFFPFFLFRLAQGSTPQATSTSTLTIFGTRLHRPEQVKRRTRYLFLSSLPLLLSFPPSFCRALARRHTKASEERRQNTEIGDSDSIAIGHDCAKGLELFSSSLPSSVIFPLFLAGFAAYAPMFWRVAA